MILKPSLATALLVVVGQLFPACCRGGDGTFSNDGQRVYVIAGNDVPNQNAALQEIDLASQTSHIIPLPQIPKNDSVVGITRTPWDKLAVLTSKSIWALDPRSGKLSKIRDVAKNGY